MDNEITLYFNDSDPPADPSKLTGMAKTWYDKQKLWNIYFDNPEDQKKFNRATVQVLQNGKLWRDVCSPMYLRTLLDGIVVIARSGLPAGSQYGYWDIHAESDHGQEIVVCRPMYKALIAVVTRGNHNLAFIKAEVIREGDEFEDLGIATPPKHKINLEGNGKIIGSYAVAGFKSGQYTREICTNQDLATIEKKIKMSKYHYINEFRGEWAKIRAIRRLAKSLAQAMTPEQIDRLAFMEELDNQDYEVTK